MTNMASRIVIIVLVSCSSASSLVFFVVGTYGRAQELKAPAEIRVVSDTVGAAAAAGIAGVVETAGATGGFGFGGLAEAELAAVIQAYLPPKPAAWVATFSCEHPRTCSEPLHQDRLSFVSFYRYRPLAHRRQKLLQRHLHFTCYTTTQTHTRRRSGRSSISLSSKRGSMGCL